MTTKRKGPAGPRVRMKLVPEQVAKAVALGGAKIDSGQLLAALIDCWGGPVRFSQDIFAEYQNAKPGSLTRQRILEMVSRLTVQVTQQQMTRVVKPADLSDEELAATARALLEKLGGGDG